MSNVGRALLLVSCLLLSWPSAAQSPPEPQEAEDLTIPAFLRAVQTSLLASDPGQWAALLSAANNRDESLAFFAAMAPEGITRVVLKERDRAPLAGTLPGQGFRLTTEVFIETGARGRITTWLLDIRRPRGDDTDPQPWRIVAQNRLSSVDGLHRLALDVTRQYMAHNLVLQAVDFEIRLPAGQVFVATTDDGVTAVAIVGDGSMHFAPKPKEERGQVSIFSGAEVLDTPFANVFVRLSPDAFETVVAAGMLVPAAVDGRGLRRAQQLFEEEVSNSFSLDLSDLSRDTWSLLPQPGDFVAELRTRRYGKLTYARSSAEPEDVSLFQRERKRNISVYASEQKLAGRGRFFDEDDLVEYDILDYNIDTTFAPEREWMEGRARLRLRVKAYAMGVLTLKLAEALTVSSVTSEELGRLLFLRVRNQNSIVINLPNALQQGSVLNLTVAYQGPMARRGIDDESVAVAGEQGRAGQGAQQDDIAFLPPEPYWVFSNRSQWYPQGQVTDYATATLRITVPADHAVVASGALAAGSPAITGVQPNGQGGRAIYVFLARQPVRYLAMVVSKMTRADAATVVLDIEPPADLGVVNGRAPDVAPVGARNAVALAVDANRRQEGRGRDMLYTAADVLRFYAGLMGDMPYEALTVAMVENNLPGGHAPGYFAVLNNPMPASPFTWRNDPAAFASFPEFFVAHELAHQWFGQAVGWQNYHEQWLSEGFAQYMAALFAREQRGEEVFRDVIKQFRRFAMESSPEGPVYLGYRLGHIKGESRVFRALVYNKGAAVLHMLRRLVGDEAFFVGLRGFYAENRFGKAGTDDLRKAMQAASGRDLTRFFEQWIFDVDLPRLRFSSTVVGSELTVHFEQVGAVFDVPVTVAVQYADGRTVEHVVLVTDATVEQRIPLEGAVRSVEVNQDGAALATIEKR